MPLVVVFAHGLGAIASTHKALPRQSYGSKPSNSTGNPGNPWKPSAATLPTITRVHTICYDDSLLSVRNAEVEGSIPSTQLASLCAAITFDNNRNAIYRYVFMGLQS